LNGSPLSHEWPDARSRWAHPVFLKEEKMATRYYRLTPIERARNQLAKSLFVMLAQIDMESKPDDIATRAHDLSDAFIRACRTRGMLADAIIKTVGECDAPQK
jgi:hypothetical protein